MKHKWTNNLGLKVLSLLVSCLIWLVVTNTNDPESTQVYKNVPITIKNQDTVTKIIDLIPDLVDKFTGMKKETTEESAVTDSEAVDIAFPEA